jgi:hypothetical protein
MIWIILLNFVAALFSIGLIWIGFCETSSSDLILGIILLIVNLSCLVFNLTRTLLDK